jgi:hypothetical protein
MTFSLCSCQLCIVTWWVWLLALLYVQVPGKQPWCVAPALPHRLVSNKQQQQQQQQTFHHNSSCDGLLASCMLVVRLQAMC